MARIRVCGVCQHEVRSCICDDEPDEPFVIDDGGDEDPA